MAQHIGLSCQVNANILCNFAVSEKPQPNWYHLVKTTIYCVSPLSYSGVQPAVWEIPAKAGIQETLMTQQPAVYILANRRNGTLYIGVTSDLVKRIWENRNNLVEGSTKRYGVHQLVWYEVHASMESAIQREKRLKDWKRKWKVQLIEKINPDWDDLYHLIV